MELAEVLAALRVALATADAISAIVQRLHSGADLTPEEIELVNSQRKAATAAALAVIDHATAQQPPAAPAPAK